MNIYRTIWKNLVVEYDNSDPTNYTSSLLFFFFQYTIKQIDNYAFDYK